MNNTIYCRTCLMYFKTSVEYKKHINSKIHMNNRAARHDLDCPVKFMTDVMNCDWCQCDF